MLGCIRGLRGLGLAAATCLLSGCSSLLDLLGDEEVATDKGNSDINPDPLADDNIADKHPQYDPSLTIDEQFGRCGARLNKSGSVTKLDIPEQDPSLQSFAGALYPSYGQAAQALSGFPMIPSMEVVQGMLKPFDDERFQATLARGRPAPHPAEVLTQHPYCWIKGFNSWSELPVPIHVLLIRERYADGHCQEWALMTTRDYVDPPQARTDYHDRVKIEERHRQLKCFHDLSDFQSRAQNVMVAQVVFILLSYTLRQWQLWRLHAQTSPDQTPELMRRRLNLRRA